MTGGLYDLFCIFTNNSDEYEYELRGIEDIGFYNFSLSRMNSNGSEIVFTSMQIPIHAVEGQKYMVNWTALELGLSGVSVFVDIDGDGTYDRFFSCDSWLTTNEFWRGVLPGDINEDGIVDIFDAILLANSFGKQEVQTSYNPDANLNFTPDQATGKQVIDIFDAIILANHYNQHYP
jgi:hypothetical protein